MRFVCGVAPSFVGLHDYNPPFYAGRAHACYPWHLNLTGPLRHTPVVVLPHPPRRETVVHELAHVLHYRLAFEPAAPAVTTYGETNDLEAFAEYVTTGLFHGYGDEDTYQRSDLRHQLAAIAAPRSTT